MAFHAHFKIFTAYAALTLGIFTLLGGFSYLQALLPQSDRASSLTRPLANYYRSDVNMVTNDPASFVVFVLGVMVLAGMGLLLALLILRLDPWKKNRLRACLTGILSGL